MQLRPYQQQAVTAVYEHLRTRDDNPCIVLPTAAGKTHVIATICRDAVQTWHGRVLILAHVRELLEQAAEKLHLVAPDLPVGVYSAGLKRRDLGYAVTIAGIQSVYQKACDVGAVDLVVVDEAHLIPPDGEGMYRTFLADMKQVNPLVRIIGLTATPFRMKSGTICAPDNILNEACFEVGVRELIVQGYLCPLRTKAGTQRPDYDQLHIRGGEYVAGEVEDLMDNDNLVLSACREIVEHTRDRKSVLIFASGVRHGEHICRVLNERHKVECGFVCGETLPFQRDEALRRFRAGELKYLCNVNVLTTGFDAPNIDCVALVRPTLSPGLYYQMVGRGFRLHPGKTDCLVLDFGGNVLRHGPVDAIRLADPESKGNGDAPAKECPTCHALIAAGYATCPECGHEFPERQRSKHEATAGTEAILSDQVTRTEYEVDEVFYAVHVKRDAPPDAPRTMRVDYKIGFQTYVSEWVCFEHQGYPRQKAEIWWRTRSDEPVPGDAEEAVERAQAGALAPTVAITIERREGDRFDRVVAYRLGDKPAIAETPPELACPDCGKAERSLQPGSGPHETKEVCAWCGRWLRWVPQAEADARWAEEVPF
jgi:DNA repair protein RadD